MRFMRTKAAQTRHLLLEKKNAVIYGGAIETFSRILAGELGLEGIRVVLLRPDAIPEAVVTSHARDVFDGFARRAGTTVDAMLAERARSGTLLKRFPTLAEVADFSAYLASDRAGATTGAIVNLTCGTIVDQC
jgi:NAD(P)-dependent dehydrogenase (short-subunit alcohol dehydrogenase family)